MPEFHPIPNPTPQPAAADRFLTLQNVADRLNVSIRYVRELRASGALPVVRLGLESPPRPPEDLGGRVEARMVRARAAGGPPSDLSELAHGTPEL